MSFADDRKRFKKPHTLGMGVPWVRHKMRGVYAGQAHECLQKGDMEGYRKFQAMAENPPMNPAIPVNIADRRRVPPASREEP
jgi:hypothetical protein